MSKVPKYSKFRAAQMFKMAVFGASKWPKIEFTENLSARKFLKSPHCEFLIFRFSLKNLKTRQNGHFSKTYVNHPKLILQDFINFFISRNFLPHFCRLKQRFQPWEIWHHLEILEPGPEGVAQLELALPWPVQIKVVTKVWFQPLEWSNFRVGNVKMTFRSKFLAKICQSLLFHLFLSTTVGVASICEPSLVFVYIFVLVTRGFFAKLQKAQQK